MASNKDDVSWDDDGLGDFGDDSFPEMPGDGGGRQQGVFKPVATGMLEGFTGHMRDPRNQVKFAKSVLPDGYSRAIDIADETASGLSELYHHTLTEAKPVIDATRKLLQMTLPSESKFIPKKWLDAIHKMDDSYKTPSEEEINETAIASAMGDIFKVQEEKQDKRYEEQQAKEDARTAITVKSNAKSLQTLMGIQTGIARLVGYQDTVNAGYQRKSLELQFRSYFVQRRLLDDSQKHFIEMKQQLEQLNRTSAMPDSEKATAAQTARDYILSRAFSNIDSWSSGLGARLLKNAKQEVTTFMQEMGGNLQMLLFAAESAKDAAEFMPGGKFALAGQTVGSAGAKWLTGKIAKPLQEALGKNETIRKWGFNLKNMTGLLGQRANQWMKSGEYLTPEMFHGFEDVVRSLMGQSYTRDTEIGKIKGIDELDKASQMTNLTKRSLEEVIPGWLGKIHHELAIIRTGDATLSPLEWDWEEEDFSTVEKKADRIRERIFDKRDAARFSKSIKDLYRKIVPADTPLSELSKESRKRLRSQLMERATNEQKFDPKDWRDDPSEVGEFIRKRFKVTSEWDSEKGQTVTKMSTDADVQELLSEALAGSEEAMRYFPDIREKLRYEMAAGNRKSINRLGIMSRSGNNFFADEAAYRQAFLGKTAYESIPEIMGPMQQHTAPFLSRHKGGLVKGGGANTRFVSPHVFAGAPRFHIGGVGGMEPGEVPVIIKEGEEVVTPDDPRHVYNTNFEEVVEAFKKELLAKMDEGNVKEDVVRTNQLLWNILQLNVQAMQMMPRGGAGGGGKMHWADRSIHGVLDLGRDFKNYMVKGWKQSGALLSKGFGKIGKGLSWVGDKLRGKADDVTDILTSARNRIALTAHGIRNGIYRDVNTGKVIEKIKDITGAVIRIDKEPHEEVLSAEEYAKGLYNNYGKRLIEGAKDLIKNLWGKATRPADAAWKFVKDLTTITIGYIKAPEDVYVKGDPKPRLRAHIMRSGGYRLRHDPKKLVQSIADIKGEVETIDGKELLISSDELNKLVDSEGNPVKTNMEKIAGAVGWAVGKVKEGGKKAWEMMGKAFGTMKDVAGDLWKRTKAFMGIGDGTGQGGSVSLFLGGAFVSGSKRIIVEIRRLYNMLNHRLAGEPGEDLPLNIDKDFDANGNLMPGITSKFKNYFKNFNANQFKESMKNRFTNAKDWLTGKFKQGRDRFNASGIREGATNLMGDVGFFAGALRDNVGVRMGQAKDAIGGKAGKAKDFFGKMGDAISTAIEEKKEKNRYQDWLKKNANPGDGDGQREGGWQDRISDRAKAEELERQQAQVEENKKQSGYLSKLVSLFTKNNKLQEEQIEAIEEDEEDDDTSWVGTILSKLGLGKVGQWIGDKLTGITSAVAESAVGTAIGNMISSATEGIGKFFSRGGVGAAGPMAAGAGGKVINAVAGAAGRLGTAAMGLGSSLVGGAVGMAGTALSGLAAMVFSPIGLAVGAVAAAGYVGYNMFQAFKKRKQYLTKFRYLQYGFDPGGTFTDGDDEEIETITKLEQMLIPFVSFTGGNARINPGNIQVEDMIKVFEVDPENVEDVQTWVAWFAARFRPIFLTHMKMLNTIGKGRVKLWEIDEKFTTDQRIEYLKAVGSFPYDTGPYMIPDSPFPKGWTDFGEKEVIDIEPEDIKDGYDDAMENIEDDRGGEADKKQAEASDGGKDSPGKKPEASKGFFATAVDIVKAPLLAVKEGFGKLMNFFSGANQLSEGYGGKMASMLGVTSPFAKGFLTMLASPVTLATLALQGAGILKADTLQLTKDGVNQLTKFRMYQYGWSIVNSDGIDKTLALEQVLMPHVRTGASVTLAETAPMSNIFACFDIDQDDDEEVTNFITWFDGRFKPVFLSHMAVCSQMKVTNLHDVDKKLKPSQKLDYIERVHFTDGRPYAVMKSPIPIPWYKFRIFGANTELEVDGDDVNGIFKKYKDQFKEEIDKAKKKETGEDKDLIDKDSMLGRARQAVSNVLGGAVDKAKEAIGGAWKASTERLNQIYENSKKAISDWMAPLGDAVSKAGSFLAGIGSKVLSPLTTFGSQLGTAAAKYVAKKGDAKKNEQAMIDAAMAAGINDPKELAMLLAQVDHESGGFGTVEENLNYRAETLMKISTTARNKGLAAVTAAVQQGAPAIAELMYGGRMGNDQPGDGFKYRGRGFIQLTGKDNYAAASAALGIDLVKNPDLAAHPENAAKIAIWYWKSRVGAAGKTGDVLTVTKKINGGTIGLSDRESHYKGYLDKIAKGEVKATPPGGAKTAVAGTSAVPPPPPGQTITQPTPEQTKAAALVAKPTPEQAKPAPTVATASPAKAAAAQQTLAAAAPAAVMAASPSAPAASTPASSSGMVPVSTGSAAQVAAAKQRDEMTKAQLETQRVADAASSNDSLKGLSGILGEQLKLQISMEQSLRALVEKASMPGMIQPGAQVASNNGGIPPGKTGIYGSPSANKSAPVNMGRA